MREEEVPRQADGPLVKVRLPDGQVVHAVVRTRRKERDGSWWYDVRIHVPSQVEESGRLRVAPAPVSFRVPAELCEQVPGQAYGRVPTERYGVAPDWRIERPVYIGRAPGPARVVHRGTCRAVRDMSAAASSEEARDALLRDDTVPCPVCRPDRPLKAA
ncbi:DUF6233 domain-containing protein [Streptomyces sp. NBC_01476]|uniref:DUF6233 domain-containing protein n=1 Tax=Streptomyces sp. NBC_01476 TaxID=2903881 RepID=UPI002E31631D|nr:DUF6233 domain-containing protein [Streptomyces sp. NBC_01476]